MTGIRVIELCDERGVLAGKLLADMGAHVIKVEPPSGDRTRSYEPFVNDKPHLERSLYYWHYNTSKRGITLKLEDPRGRELFKRLVAGADMFLESQDPGTLGALGLDYAALSPLNARLIMVSVTPFGQGGPRAHEAANDLTIFAGGGPAWNNGYDDHSLPPVRGGGNQAYHTGSHYAVMAALVALLHRNRSGRGQHIDVNMHAAANVTTEAGSYTWMVARQTVQRQTGRHAGVTPTMASQVLCADGRYANTGVPPRKPGEFLVTHKWLEEMGLLDEFPAAPLLLIGAERERIDFSRLAEDEELQAIFGAGRDAMTFIASKMTAYDFFVGAQKRGFQVGVIYSPEEVFQDEHFIERGFPVEVNHPEIDRTITYPGAPYAFKKTPWHIRRRAPQLGEDNAEVYGELGLSAAEIAELKAKGII
jgi:crotonobetainyl-CoA:carnitine CoA-transferase CaiB-like acyl-CoA transferase